MVLLLESCVRSQSLVDASGKVSTLPSDSDRAGIEAVKSQTYNERESTESGIIRPISVNGSRERGRKRMGARRSKD